MSNVVHASLEPPPRVAVHEHSDALRATLLLALESEGLSSPLGMPSAAELLDTVSTLRPDVLLLDLDAPDGDALTLCRRLRQDHPRLGILATSTRSDGHRLTHALEAGADVLLTKPLSATELAAHVRRLHARAQAWARSLQRTVF